MADSERDGSNEAGSAKTQRTILRGNYRLRSQDGLTVDKEPVQDQTLTEEFERKARDKIGGSIAFVTRIKGREDALFWDGE